MYRSMRVFLALEKVSKAYGVHEILSEITLTLNDGDRVGLVGANGVGKSTLLKIIIGQIESDSGAVWSAEGAQIGYLAQTDATTLANARTVADAVATATAHLHALEAQMRDLETLMGDANRADQDAILAAYADVSERFEVAGGYEIEHRLNAVFGGLGIGYVGRDQRIETLSGGERARLGLALLLLQNPDVLLLDEPTNHLDFASLSWLEGYLSAYRGAMLIAAHDRQFLNRTVTAIAEIDEHSRRLREYAGNYDAYQREKTIELTRWREDYARQQEEIKELRHEIKVEARQVAHNRPKTVDGDKFLKGFKKGRLSVAIARRMHSAEEQLKRIEADPIPRPPDTLHFDVEFEPASLKGRLPLVVSGVSKTYVGRTVLRDVTFTLGVRSRIALIGPNGAGKSTLLRLIAGLEQPDSGEITLNPQVKLGYLEQDRGVDAPALTLFDAYRDGLDANEQQLKAALLGSGMFRYAELERETRALSAGQKRKLQIARIIAERANMLLLDEPTNYISFDVVESFEAALRDFPGPIIAATHDRRFIEHFGGEVWEIKDGCLSPVTQFSPAP